MELTWPQIRSERLLRSLSGVTGRRDLEAYRDHLAASDDLLDSVIASLTARATARQSTLLPAPDQSHAASEEGWIHLPTRPLTELNR
ncbi:DUF429 domain-containing protein [Arthrobacter sp. NPDC058097]|uniref:DUF429 domain-containing protein n=1 Tax=Arthrobacter sp. NPDC058097 TaxID=3346340 RepID=UPI0036D77DED